jgi:hypothetical protein
VACPSHGGVWVRARPIPNISSPVLHSPGARTFKTQPDGLWLSIFNPIFADAICIEVCGSIQNLNDKRSRYMPSSHSLMVTCPRTWLNRDVRLPKSGRKPLWKRVAGFSKAPESAVSLPIRLLRVLYALNADDYDKWIPTHVPTGYEYFCVNTSLGSYNSQKMQSFLRQMSVRAQFYTRPHKPKNCA